MNQPCPTENETKPNDAEVVSHQLSVIRPVPSTSLGSAALRTRQRRKYPCETNPKLRESFRLMRITCHSSAIRPPSSCRGASEPGAPATGPSIARAPTSARAKRTQRGASGQCSVFSRQPWMPHTAPRVALPTGPRTTKKPNEPTTPVSNPGRPAGEPPCLHASFFPNEPKAPRVIPPHAEHFSVVSRLLSGHRAAAVAHQSRERQRPDLQSPTHQQVPAPNEAKPARVLSHQFSVASGRRPAAHIARPIQPPRAGRRSSPRPNRRDNQRQTKPSAPPIRIATFPATPFVPACLRAFVPAFIPNEPNAARVLSHQFSVTSGQVPAAYTARPIQPPRAGRRSSPRPNWRDNRRQTKPSAPPTRIATFPPTPSVPTCLRASLFQTNPKRSQTSPTTSPSHKQAFVPVSLRPCPLPFVPPFIPNKAEVRESCQLSVVTRNRRPAVASARRWVWRCHAGYGAQYCCVGEQYAAALSGLPWGPLPYGRGSEQVRTALYCLVI